jgi:glycerophosphoryl diester phosphodiesterase
MKKMTCIAHRGASGHEPENTLLAIQKALDLGAEWVEIDVYPVENELVVIHDDALERTTNGKGTVLQSSLEYLRSLDAGKGEQIPYLSEVFDIIGSRAKLNIELKWIDTAKPATSSIKKYVDHHGWTYERILISSLFHDEVKKAKSLIPEILTAPVFVGPPPDDFMQTAKDLNAYSLSIDVDYINTEIVEKAHQMGLKIFAFTINTMAEIEKMKDIGVDGIFTNYPELLTM